MKGNEFDGFFVFVLALTLLGGCAGSEEKSDESPKQQAKKTDQDGDGGEKAAETHGKQTSPPDVGEDLPDLEPLELRDEAPKAEKTGEANGVVGYRVGDLRVVHKPTPANQVVSAQLVVDGGVAGLTDRIAGIEQLALNVAVNGGTESTSEDEFSSELDSMGSSISSFASRDYSGVSMRTIVKHFDETWGLFAEAILEPAMPAEEIDVQREKQIASIQKIRENPNQLAGVTARKLIARNHPYHRFQHGNVASLKAFERDHVLAYHRSLLDPSRLVLVVVGDIETETLIEKVRATLGRLPSGDWERPSVPDFDVDGVRIDGVEKSIPTNYILGLFPAPAPGHDDYPAAKVALAYLSDRLFEEVRTKRNLSYAVSSGLSAHRANNGYLYVSAKRPNETLGVMFDAVRKLRDEKLSEKELQRTRNVFITEHYMDLETNANQARNLAKAELIRGDWREHANFIEEMKSVTPADVQKVAEKYLADYQFGVVGKPKSIDKSVVTGSD